MSKIYLLARESHKTNIVIYFFNLDFLRAEKTLALFNPHKNRFCA